jgi:threonine/homoserine/homoserine lactone efflux protein
MDFHLWLAFAAASFLMAVIPGPGVTSIVGFAITAGRQAALASVLGMAIGNLTAMTLSLAGVGALLAASTTAFTILKIAGAAYLVLLGVMAIVRAGGKGSPAAAKPVTSRAALLTNIAVGTFHPKTIVFFIAFGPQFIVPHLPYATQAVLMILTFVGVAVFTDTLYALAASRAAGVLRSPRAQLWAGRLGGGVLIVAGLATAYARR